MNQPSLQLKKLAQNNMKGVSQTGKKVSKHPFEYVLRHKGGQNFKKPYENALYQTNVIMPTKTDVQKVEIAL